MVVIDKEKSDVREPSKLPDFALIEKSASFQGLMKKKKRFLVPSILLFLGLYILFPLIISYTDVLNTSFIGDISWSWVYALGLFIMTWTLVTVYMKKAAEFDRMAEETLKEFNYEEGHNQ
ncbi:DUF485 domain-containing protein [Paenisporosarcina indica]|uniref:DUF485 domain-containing protein n=1 Tax=Paenisporosarcina indica TaxID=650093 RepID=UPI00094F9955|nr:DUF485 domain-containing protein [Paenisporosarcina indica]